MSKHFFCKWCFYLGAAQRRAPLTNSSLEEMEKKMHVIVSEIRKSAVDVCTTTIVFEVNFTN